MTWSVYQEVDKVARGTAQWRPDIGIECGIMFTFHPQGWVGRTISTVTTRLSFARGRMCDGESSTYSTVPDNCCDLSVRYVNVCF